MIDGAVGINDACQTWVGSLKRQRALCKFLSQGIETGKALAGFCLSSFQIFP